MLVCPHNWRGKSLWLTQQAIHWQMEKCPKVFWKKQPTPISKVKTHCGVVVVFNGPNRNYINLLLDIFCIQVLVHWNKAVLEKDAATSWACTNYQGLASHFSGLSKQPNTGQALSGWLLESCLVTTIQRPWAQKWSQGSGVGPSEGSWPVMPMQCQLQTMPAVYLIWSVFDLMFCLKILHRIRFPPSLWNWI